MATAAELAVVITGDSSGFDGALGKAGKSVAGFGKIAAAGFAAAGVAAVAAAGLVAKEWFDAASDANQALDNLQAKLGLTAQEAKFVGDVGKESFASNWADSIGEATERAGDLIRAMDFQVTKSDLKEMTDQSFALAQVFELGGEEQVRALENVSKAFVDIQRDGTKFGDMVATVMQTGGKRADDLLETLNEYSPLMAEMGFSSEQFFGVLQSGLQAGARDTDFVADLFKEFGIRITDGSKASADALATIDMSHLIGQMSEGQITGVEAFEAIRDALFEMEDPTKRNEAAVALMGTKYEDLGPAVVEALDLGPLTNFEDAAIAAGDAINNNIGSALGRLKRAFEVLDFGDGLGFAKFEEKAIAAIDNVTAAVPRIASAVSEVSGAFIEGFSFAEDSGPLGNLGDAIANASLAMESLGLISEDSTDDFFDVASALTAIDDVVAEVTAKFDILRPSIDKVVDGAAIISGMFRNLAERVFGDIVGGAIDHLRTVWEEDFGGMQATTTRFVLWWRDNVAPTIEHVINLVVAKMEEWTRFWDEHGETIMTIVRGIWDVVIGVFEVGFGILTQIITAVLAAIRGDWATFGEAMRTSSETTTKGVARIFEGLKKIFGTIFRELVRMAKEKAAEIGTSIKDGLVNAIENARAAVWGAITDLMSGMIGAAMDALVAHSPSKVFEEIAQFVLEGFLIGLGNSKIKRQIFDEMAGIVSAMASMATDMIKAIKVISEFELPAELDKIGDKFRLLTARFLDMVGTIRAISLDINRQTSNQGLLNIWDAGNITAFARVMSAAADSVVAVADAIKSMTDVSIPAAGMFASLRGTIEEIIDLADDMAKRFEKVEAGGLASLAVGIKAMVDLTANVASVAAGWPEALTDIRDDLGLVKDIALDVAALFADQLVEWAKMDEDAQRLASGSAASFAAAIKAVVDLVGTVGAVAGDWPEKMTDIRDSLKSVKAQALAVAVLFEDQIAIWHEIGEDVQRELVTSIETFVSGISAVIGLMADARDAFTGWDNVAVIGLDVLQRVAGNIAGMAVAVGGIRDLVVTTGGGFAARLEDVIAGIEPFTESARAIVALMADAGGVTVDWSKTTEVTAAAMSKVEANLMAFSAALIRVGDFMVGDEGGFGTRLRDALPGMDDFVSALSAVVDLMATAGGVVVDWSKTSAASVDVVAIIETNMLEFARALDRIVATLAGEGIGGKALAGLAETAGSLGAIVTAFGSVASTMAKMKEASAALLSADLIAVVGANVEAIAKEFARIGRVLKVDGIKAAGDMGDAATKAIGAFSAALDIVEQVTSGAFFSASKRVGGATSSSEFRNTRTAEVFAARIKAAIQESVKVVVDAMKEIKIPADFATRFDPLKAAADAIAGAFDVLNGIEVPAALDEILQAVAVFSGSGGALAGAGGGTGGGTVPITLLVESATITRADVPELGLALDVRLGDEPLPAMVTAGYQRDPRTLDELIALIDQRRAGRP